MPNQNTGSIPNSYLVCGKTTKIFLNKGLVCLVDTVDFWSKLSHIHWHAVKDCKTFYAVNKRTVKGVNYSLKMHRLINNTPKDMLTDHINGNGLDNRKLNLRTATNKQNSFNRIRFNPSGYYGVNISTYKGKKYYRASICVDGKITHIGSFPDAVSAAKAYDLMAVKLHGTFAKQNFKVIKNA